MRIRRTWPALLGATATLILGVAAGALGQETQKFKGLIVGRDGPNMIVKNEEANMTTTVTLDDSTKVQAIKGKLGVRKSEMGMAALIPGLPVEVEAQSSNGQLIAKLVKFKASALKTANMIQAGVTPTQQQPTPACETNDACHPNTATTQSTGTMIPPASATSNPSDNITPKRSVSPSKAVRKAKPLTASQRLLKALHTCRSRYKHHKHKRIVCEQQARRRYVPHGRMIHKAATGHTARNVSGR